ncbi:MAG: hypothetical protein ABI759_32160 [Candidatus Solibacter sp.]
MHRVFCANDWELEEERVAFDEILSSFNEHSAMPAGVLYVPVSLAHIHDKRPYQYTVDENVRSCRHYLLLPGEDWGPKERALERDYRLARKCAEDPAMPMRGVAILLRPRPDGSSPMAATLDTAGFPYTLCATTEDYRAAVTRLFESWLAEDLAAA